MFTVGSFGFILFAALLAGLWRVTPQPRRWQLMLAASLVFYLSLDWQGCLLLCLMTLLVWQAALHLRGSPRWFYVGLAGALAPLTLLRLRPAALLLGQAFSLRIWDVSVPQVLGIGYFSLQLISYLVDVRRGKQEPESQYARLLCFASFFLSITQGPFNRYDELMPQLDAAAPQPGRPRRAGRQRRLCCPFRLRPQPAVSVRSAVCVPALRRFLRLHRHRAGGGGDAGPAPAGKLPPAVFGCHHPRTVGPLAHQPVPLAERLRLHPAGRQPMQRRATAI